MAESNEQGLPLRIYRCKASEEYANRILALGDVVFAIKCLVHLRRMNASPGENELIREALWNSSVIRAFSIFPRPIGLEILDALPEGAREVFRFFKNYRDKHVGHRGNPIDQVKAGVFLGDGGNGRMEVVGIGHLAMQDTSFSDQEMVDSLGRFLDALKLQLEKESAAWGEQMMKDARQENIERLAEFDPLRVVVPESGYLHKGDLTNR